MKKAALKQMLIAIELLTALIFVINTSYANPIGWELFFIQSPQNKIYISNEVELKVFTPPPIADYEPPFVMLCYCLDDGSEVVIDGNKTLKDLSSGSHSLVVYAKNEKGETVASQTVNFDVSPLSGLVMISVIVAVVGLGWLFYFIKRKQFQKHLNN